VRILPQGDTAGFGNGGFNVALSPRLPGDGFEDVLVERFFLESVRMRDARCCRPDASGSKGNPDADSSFFT
jgi:hypothetical protein